ncbi:DUF5677 domain-containing protein [Sphaerimonospora cavernae]|uniref:DUF5677 domain-containing protein n=1 Tax=Sphaerimonospora cavernae TaxID=1740611 RepID=A0ABV6U946_9ACTN
MHPNPATDPYSSLSGVIFLDEKLEMLQSRITRIGESSRKSSNLTRLQKAALQLVPASASIAKSIRQMIKDGYLLSAMILFRHLIERIATLSYLREHQEAVDLWEAGWPHGQRASLRKRLATLIPGASEEILSRFGDAVAKYNSLIHGDPLAAQQGLIKLSENDVVYVSDRDYVTLIRAGSIALETAIAVVFLIVMIDAIFPDTKT